MHGSDNSAMESGDAGSPSLRREGAGASQLTPALPRDEAVLQLQGLVAGESDLIANMANMSAFLNTVLPDINWVGFYLLRGDELVLGPFQGQSACVRIPVSKGVCGACVRTRRTQRVDDVHAFPGHIACDARSRAELVVPLCMTRQQGSARQAHLPGVLDIDSPAPARFSAADQDYVEALVDAFVDAQFAV